MFKKVISVLLLLALIAGIFLVSANAAESQARLYTVYGNGMLFEQNKAAILAGEGKPGSVIKAQLFNENYWPISTGSSRVKADGTFEVSFIAPAGSYKEYTIELTQDGDKFAELTRYVFFAILLRYSASSNAFALFPTTATVLPL